MVSNAFRRSENIAIVVTFFYISVDFINQLRDRHKILYRMNASVESQIAIMKDFISFKDSQHIYHTKVFQEFSKNIVKVTLGDSLRIPQKHIFFVNWY